MKLLFYLFSIALIFSACEQKNDNAKYIFFQDKYKKITEPSPAELCLSFLKQIEEADESSPFSKWTPEMINRQCAAMYRLNSEELVELIIDILQYKKIVTNNKKCSLEEIKSFAERMRSGKPDKIDKILIKSFDLMIEYNIEQSKLENNL
jgi:hypothetical protein